jgi:transcription initiation factor TFIIIB Brf1 subunit/transcription initiation factor TFIIB
MIVMSTSVLDIDSCEHPNFIVSNGERVCTSCGWCDDKYIDFDDRFPFTNPTVAYPVLFGQSVTTVGSISEIFNTADQRMQVYKIRKLNRQYNTDSTIESRIFKFLVVVKGILELSDQLYLGVIHQFRTLYKKLPNKNRRSYALLATILYNVAKNTPNPLKRSQIIKVFNNFGHSISNKKINDVILDLNLDTKTVTTALVFPSLLGKLKIKHDTQKILNKCNEILKKSERVFDGRGVDPYALASAILHYCLKECGNERTQKEVAKAGNTTPVTIMNHLKLIVRSLHS